MSHSVFDILEEQGLKEFNKSVGRSITYSMDPGVEYSFPETDIEIYSLDTSFRDVIHPYRPSSEYLVQAVHRGHLHYFEGSEDEMRALDIRLTRELDGLDPSDYYKKIAGS